MDATPHIIESALLLLTTFLVGCLIGHYIRRVAGNITPAAMQSKPASPSSGGPKSSGS